MIITRKIEKDEKKLEEERAKIIEKGGAVSMDAHKKGELRKSVVLRFPKDFLDKIDQAVEKRVGMNRMAWLLQAAQEKLERDND